MDKRILKALAWMVLIIVLIAAVCAFMHGVWLRPAAMEADAPAWGIGRVQGEAPLYASPVCRDEEFHSMEEYTEGDAPVPEWYRPDEPMAIEWADHSGEADEMVNGQVDRQSDCQSDSVDYIAHPPIGIDPGGVDWNICTTVWGWNGHGMEMWEMDLFAKIFYREFWQPNLTLCEAGCDAMLQLWDLNGGTMYETLSHVNEDGSYAFSTFPGVWEAEYDPDGLAWCRIYCEERFHEGPSWPAQYFRKGQYHDWDEWSPIPAYEIDGIYFSIGKEQ